MYTDLFYVASRIDIGVSDNDHNLLVVFFFE